MTSSFLTTCLGSSFSVCGGGGGGADFVVVDVFDLDDASCVCVSDEEVEAFDESIVGVCDGAALRAELKLEEEETERRLVFGDAERGRFLSLLKFEIPLGLRAVVVVGEADLRVSEVVAPSDLTEDVAGATVEVLAGRADLAAAGAAAVFVAADVLLSLPFALPAADTGLDPVPACPSPPDISASPPWVSVALPLPFLLFADCAEAAASVAELVSFDACTEDSAFSAVVDEVEGA